MRTKPAIYKINPNRKCIAYGCVNYSHEGVFIGQLCEPCYTAITQGPSRAKYGTAWFYERDNKLERYEFLCEAFDKAYHEDGIDDQNIVNASLLAASKGWRTVQFVMNILERQEQPVDLDGFIKDFMANK